MTKILVSPLWRIGVLAVALLLGFGLWSVRAAGPEVNAPEGLAMHGYDPVAYFTDGEPMEGRAELTAEWNGATYRFVTAANRDAFVADPAAYAPQYGGYCAMGTSLGKKIDVDPAQWRVVDGKLYLNSSAGAHNAWTQDVPGNIMKADGNWPEIKDKDPSELN
jgi:YHS domain-containing protein